MTRGIRNPMLLQQRFVALVLLLLIVPGMRHAPGAHAQQAQASVPTAGDIVVDTFDCEALQLWFHVPVANLPLSPSLETLGYSVQGPDNLNPTATYRPDIEVASYTGNVYLSSRAPVTDLVPSDPALVLEITVYVGNGEGTGLTDTSTAVFDPDCVDAGASTDDIVQELVAILIAVLSSILGSGDAP